MEKVQTELADLKAQGALVAESLKAMNESIQGLGAWMPKVDTSITTIQQTIAEMGARVTALEATRSAGADHTPRWAPSGKQPPGPRLGRSTSTEPCPGQG
ncbi:hypothetical protein QYE76_021098 [Lolium multiflorum]|uniref:Uncharacterized protein n=1 Tax=Lolium multiflorum TaxID=4521 RepID=A0AAD8R7T1_LOLMU|nr:hypothetical protein QYE76_021098 [Lolium multiflorum]